MQEYVRPATLTEALSHLQGGSFRVLAGGTDLYPQAGAGAGLAGRVVDLAAIGGLDGITFSPEIRIGATTTWTTIAETPLPPALNALQQAARQVGGRQIQNTGTIGGNLCNASPAADGVPPLLVLNAEVELATATATRRMPVAQFLIGPRRTALAAGEVLTAVIIPETALAGGSSFVKLGARSHLVISIVMVAARVVISSGRITDLSVSVGSCSAVAQRLTQIERALTGAKLADITGLIRAEDIGAALSPLDDIRASASYRIAAATELVARAITGAAG